MPKSSKKKKEKVADFTKAKLKLGKGKKLPSNVVDTSFKARSIALPTQSITIERDNVPTTKKKRTFDDVLSLLKHYNVSIQKDAISSVKELLEEFPDLVNGYLPLVLSSCARLIADEDAGVRKTLLSFFDWLLSRVPKDDLLPHAPLLLLFTTSAQTHIFPEIRIDAVRFLDLFIQVLPEAVVTGWDADGSGPGRRVLDGYLGLLNAGTKFGASGDDASATSTSSVVLSSQSRLVVLRSLSNFLRCATQSQLATDKSTTTQAALSLPTWFMRPFFTSPSLYDEHSYLFGASGADRREKQMQWTLEPTFDLFDEDFTYNPHTFAIVPDVPLALTELPGFSALQDKSDSSPEDIAVRIRLARTLFSTLSASYLECAPVVFSPSVNPPETDLQMLTASMEITRILYSGILQSASQGTDVMPSCDELKTLIGYLTCHFPFKPAHRDIKAEQAFQNLNVVYCELTSLVVLVSSWRSSEGGGREDTRTSSLSQRASLKPTKAAKSDIRTELVCAYIIRVLNGEGEGGALLPRPLTPSAYVALLPSVWALLNRAPGISSDLEDVPSSVLSAILDHAVRTTSGSAVKRLTVEFVARLLLLQGERGYMGYFSPSGVGADEKWQHWVLHLPKALWEMGCSNLSCSETILQALLRLVQRGSSVIRSEHVTSLSSRLVPFFTASHPTRGDIPGPFTKMPVSAQHTRRLALDLSATLVADIIKGERGDASHRDLERAVRVATAGTAEEAYWAQLAAVMQLS